MTVVEPSITVLRVVATSVPAVAIITTAIRLIYRWRRRALWWDDAWAFASMVIAVLLMTGMWVRSEAPGVGPVVQPHRIRVAGYIIVAFTYSIVLWFARMSILFTVIRIVPWMLRMRQLLIFVAFLYLAMFMGLVIQKVYVCFHDERWEAETNPQCHLGRAVGITELTTDFVADAILIAAPMNLLWNVRLPRKQRTLLITVFSTSILTTLSSIVHGYMLMGPSGVLEAITAHIEAAVSLIVCNLSVIVTYLYRQFAQGHDLEDSEAYSTGLAFRLTTLSGTKSRTFGNRTLDTTTIPGPREPTASTLQTGRHVTRSTLVASMAKDDVQEGFAQQKPPGIGDGDGDGQANDRDATYTVHFPDHANTDRSPRTLTTEESVPRTQTDRKDLNIV